MELRRINTTGETRKPSNRLLFDLFSDIKDSSIFLRSERDKSSCVPSRDGLTKASQNILSTAHCPYFPSEAQVHKEIHNPSASSLSSIFLIGMCLGESGQRRKSLRQNPGMRAGDNLDVGASLDQALVKPNKRRSILDPVITCDPRGVLDFAVV